jgi:hypothetical protein
LSVRFGQGRALPPFLRLIRFAKAVALVADAWTILCAALIVGWQMVVFLREGSWPALPLSFVFNTLIYPRDAVYSTASIEKIETDHLKNLAESLLQIPFIVPLLLGAALVTAFYLWLSRIEKSYSQN